MLGEGHIFLPFILNAQWSISSVTTRNPARCSPKFVSMLGHRRRRLTNIKTNLVQRRVSESQPHLYKSTIYISTYRYSFRNLNLHIHYMLNDLIIVKYI